MRAGVGCASGWLLLALCEPHAVARAQGQLAGAWQAGATTIDVAIDSWGKDCGPQPTPMRSAGGGSVQLEQQGERLIVRAQDRVLYSDRCGSPNPALRRVSSGRIGNTWTTRCRTDAQDPRQEVATYTLELLSPDRLRYRDQSHFDWRLHASTCKATITTTQLLERRVTTVAAPAGAPGTPDAVATTGGAGAPPVPASTSPPACTPGAPVRLSLRPSKVELALGERTCFEARVVDAQACPVPNPQLRFTLEHGPGIRAQLDGRCFRAAERSAEGEGVFRVLASLSGLQAEAQVRVSAEQLPSLIAARVQSSAITGMPDAPSAGAAAPRPEARPPAPAAASASRVAGRAAPENEPSARRLMLLALALVLVLAAVAFVLRRERGAAPTRAASASTSTATATSASAGAGAGPAVGTLGLRCPRCGARFPAGNAFCGADGERLVSDP